METNVYEAPKTDLLTSEEKKSSNSQFYIVSIRKFLFLYIGTVGLYGFIWFYKNWAQYKRTNNLSIWPVPRSIFYIFFTHTLFRKVDETLGERSKALWSPQTLATGFVLAAIVGSICDRLSYNDVGSPITDLVSLALLPVSAWLLCKAQQVINVACNDPEGQSNSQFTVANIIWLIIGALFWVLIFLGLFMVFVGDQPFTQG
ncbi:hypothetical protein BTA51_19375 [Hahella sp. CCB-MM4]|uniref:hypothetical protein n=1 Tax=Hahella sp. (strain CCB-MM4) TaxID=1926491 RepID=UPI000B9AE052|nr:hypothetical protein [Hahella sp. CCB-MM4]OZG71791.1 hypothetical protein BTA51_19375 [Hahella sp. CCB-MM4]